MLRVRLATCLVAAAGCATTGPASAADTPPTRTVTIEGMKFTPQTVTLHAGERVSWINKDLFPHTATGTGFDSRAIASGASWTLVAPKRGQYPYACALHPGMSGILIVE